MKKIAAILMVACVISTLDSFAIKYDLEVGEPGYDAFGRFGAGCFLLVMPIILLRYVLWGCLSPLGFTGAIWDHHEIFYIWFTDPLIVAALFGLFFGLLYLWRLRVSKIDPRRKIEDHSLTE